MVNPSTQINNSGRDGGSSSVYRQLREQLWLLDFASFQRCVYLWLAAKGYRHIRLQGRRSAQGRRPNPGADLLACSPDLCLPVAIQIRYWQTPLQSRVVDEFWGALLRHGVPVGLLVSHGPISQAAYRAADRYPGRPIHLVSLGRLAGSCAGLGLGMTGAKIDRRFYRTLRTLSTGSENRLAKKTRPPAPCPINTQPAVEVKRLYATLIVAAVILVALLWRFH